GTSRGANGFLADTMERLNGIRLYALRADSGLFCNEFLEDLEARDLPYAIAVRMSRIVKQALVGIPEWRRVGPGLDVAPVGLELPSWRAARRLAVIREEPRERPDAAGRRLIDMPGYAFHAVVTKLSHPPVEIWRFYHGRGDCEN